MALNPKEFLVKSIRASLCIAVEARVFASRFLQTPPRGDALALRYHFTSIRL